MTEKRSRGWCFTINNYSDDDINWCYALAIEEGLVYTVVGKEVGEQGTPHLQGYIYWNTLKSLKQMKHLHDTAHWECQRGTCDQAANYCMKENDYWEHGERPMSDKQKGECGKQSIEERWELAKKGRFEELPPEQIRTYQYIHNKYRKVNDRSELDNIWICGKSGSGKSKWVRDKFGSAFYSKPMSKWWDGYNGEDVVVLEDLDKDNAVFMKFFLKIWADHYAFNAEVKNGMIAIRPKTFIVTSQYTIDDCFPDIETRNAIKRRFKVKYMPAFDEGNEIEETIYID